MNSYWNEVRNDYITESKEHGIKKEIHIDAWKTADDNEEGTVIAKVCLTEQNGIKVIYIDDIARTDKLAQEKIHEAIKIFKEERSRESYSEGISFVKENILKYGKEEAKIICEDYLKCQRDLVKTDEQEAAFCRGIKDEYMSFYGKEPQLCRKDEPTIDLDAI